MYDVGTQSDQIGTGWSAETEEADAASGSTARFRTTLQRTLKLYVSASRLALGQNRWLASAGVAGALSFALLGAGLAALIAPYASIETAALTADEAPQIVAIESAGPVASISIAAADLRPAADLPQARTEGAEIAAIDLSSVAAEPVPEGLSAADAPLEAEMTTASARPIGPQTIETKLAINSGETLMQVLTDAGADRVDAYHAIAAMRPLYSPKKLRAGQEILLTFLTDPAADDASPSKLLTAISLQPDIDRAIEVTRADDGSYKTEEFQKELTMGFAQAKGSISSSLFLDAQEAGVPAQIIVEIIRMFSYSIDFQREIHPGDTFEVFFDRKYDEDGIAVKEGQIAYASLRVDGKAHRLWRFKTADGNWDYFDEAGNSMKKFLMKTPVDGARISSGFGMRRHPILGYSKLHAGVDFAAPRGTPIYAAGDGVIKKASRYGGYGNYVSIRHANGYETAYAHMNGYARGIRKGVRVRQGQVIGYVGTTGRSTGPHLHYEIHIAGKKVNPRGIKMATGVKLSGKQLASFKATRQKVLTQMAETPLLTKVAQAGEVASKAN